MFAGRIDQFGSFELATRALALRLGQDGHAPGSESQLAISSDGPDCIIAIERMITMRL